MKRESRIVDGERFHRARPADLELVLSFVRSYYAFDHIAFDELAVCRAVAALLRDPVALPSDPGPLRPAHAADTPALLALAVATGLFQPEEAEGLLGGVLSQLHAGRLGPQHRVEVWADPATNEPVGWTYASADEHAADVWELWWIGVSPLRHGSNVGDDLLRSVEANAVAAGARMLLIATSALPPLARARAFYERRGYAVCGRVPDFYGVGDDKLIYVKRLDARS